MNKCNIGYPSSMLRGTMMAFLVLFLVLVAAVAITASSYTTTAYPSDASQFLFLTPAYGHGLDLDYIRSIDVDGTDISVSVAMTPGVEPGQERHLTFTATNDDTKDNVSNVTFLIGIFNGGQMLVRDYFFAKDGVLSIDVIPSQDQLTIHGEQDKILRAWHEAESEPIKITGPIFDSGGLYTFEIEIRTIDEPTNIIDDSQVHYADLSIIDVATHTGNTDAEGNDVTFKTKSYFDSVSKFEYNSTRGEITIEMPFDWSEKAMSHIPVLHLETLLQDDFEEFIAPSYIGYANGIELFKASVLIDDYTADNERIIHLVLLQDHLRFLKNNLKNTMDTLPDTITFTITSSDDVIFPLDAYTKGEEFLLNLSWEPIEPEPDVATTFIFTIRDGTTGEPLRNSDYEFVIVQNGKEIHRKSGMAQIGGGFEKFTFAEGQTGPTIVRFENIRNTGQDTEFGVVVVPEFGTIAMVVLIVSVGVTIAVMSASHKTRLFAPAKMS